MKKICVAIEYGTDISSRTRAAHLRAEIIAAVQESSLRVELDFNGVRTISDSFADELFGILAVKFGCDWLKANVCVENLSKLPEEAISDAISQRLEMA